MQKSKAKIMYIAVRDFGPRWDEDGNDLILQESLRENCDADDDYVE